MVFKRNEAVALYQGLDLVGDFEGVKFAYGVSKNKKILKTEMEALTDALKPKDEYKKYDKKRIELCEIHANKDKNGKPVVENGAYRMSNKKAFDKELEKLQEKYKKAVDGQKIQDEEYKKLLEEKISVKLNKVDIKNVPEEITGKQLEAIEAIEAIIMG